MIILWRTFIFAALMLFFHACFSFEVYDEVKYNGKPDLSKYGVKKLRMIYPGSFWRANEDRQFLPSKQRVTDHVKGEYADYQGLLVPDIEHWKLQGSNVQVSVDKYVTLLDWIKSAAPKARIGYYSMLPVRDYWRAVEGPSHPRYTQWQQENDRLTAIAERQAALFPSLYTFYPEREGWVRYAVAQINEAKRLGKGKPVYAFIMPIYHVSNKVLKGHYIERGFFKLQLETVKKHANGVVIWHSAKTRPWDGNAPWWLATKEFLGFR